MRSNLFSPFVSAWLKSKPSRTFLIGMSVAMVSLFIYCSLYIQYNVTESISSITEKMGADFMVLPKGNEKGNEGILIAGTPTSFYMRSEISDLIKKMDGIEKASAQIYVATLPAGCCSFPVQAIGVDMENDFTVKPWLKKDINNLELNQIIVGANIAAKDGEEIQFFGQDYVVVSRLIPTGMGFDNTLFMSYDTAYRMMKKAKVEFEEDQSPISAVMIKKTLQMDAKKLHTQLLKSFREEEITVVKANDFVGEFEKQMIQMNKLMVFLLILVITTSSVFLFVLFQIDFKDKQKELAVIRSMGASKKIIRYFLIQYSVWIAVFASALGACLAGIVLVLFHSLLNEAFQLGVLRNKIGLHIFCMMISILFSILMVLALQWKNIASVRNKEIALLLRRDE